MGSLFFFLWMLSLFGLNATFITPAPGTAETCGNLTEISEILWAAATDRWSFQVVYGDAASQNDLQADIILNLRPSQGGSLFQYVKRASYGNYDIMPTDYIPETLTPEPDTESRFYPVQQFSLDVSSTQVMRELGQYLACRGFISDPYDMFTQIFDIWFQSYPRYPDVAGANVYDSSAFENIFRGEFSSDGKTVLGLHNWYSFYLLERAGEVDLLGEIELVDPNILAFPFCWSGRYQPQGSMFVGTSIEYEMAIYMLCFYEMPGEECNVSLGGRQVTVKTEIFDDWIPKLGSAYPVVEVPQPSRNCNEVRSTTPATPTTPPPDCGSLTDISEILWAADTSRLSFGDAMTLFPDLTEYTDSSIAQAISQADPNSLPDIILNYQNNQSKLFQKVNLNNDNFAYQEFLSIMNGSYYNPEPERDDPFLGSNEQFEKLLDFLGSLLQTGPMKGLTTYILCKGYASSESELKDFLFSVWFDNFYRYGELGGADSSGFENTFMGEYGRRGNGEDQEVVGLHNWFRLYALEVDGNMDYQGFIGGIEPNAQSFSFDWNDHHQPESSMWMGSSLGFEMAIYTLCYFEKPSEDCHVSLGGHLVSVHVEISTYYDGKIFSAFPVLTVSENLTTTATTEVPTSNESPCPWNTYGPPDCLESCSYNCAVDGSCDPVNGSCTYGCRWDYNDYFNNYNEVSDYGEDSDYDDPTCNDRVCPEGSYGPPGCLEGCSFFCPVERLCDRNGGACRYPDQPDQCDNIGEVSEKLWAATMRLNFRDVRSVFPDLTEYTDDSIAEAISQADPNSLPDIIINLQASGNVKTKLFQFVNETYFQPEDEAEMYYDASSEVFNPRYLGAFQRRVMDWESNVTRELYDYLTCRGLNEYSDYISIYELYDLLWFKGQTEYSDVFQYVFMGQLSSDGTTALGLHNWFTFYHQEKQGLVELPGDIQLAEPNILAFPFYWSGGYQPNGSVFLGTSLEFEIAIYTLCFVVMPGEECVLSLGGQPVTIKTEGYYHYIQNAYPVLKRPPTTMAPPSSSSVSSTSSSTFTTTTTAATTPTTTTTSGSPMTTTTTATTTASPITTTTSSPTITTTTFASTASTSTACPPGFYGWSCSETCSMFCAGDGTCDAISGECAHGCDDGHVGLKCDAEKNGGQGRTVSTTPLTTTDKSLNKSWSKSWKKANKKNKKDRN